MSKAFYNGSKTFYDGVIYASEQSMVVVDALLHDQPRERFASRGNYMLRGQKLKAERRVLGNTKVLISKVSKVDESELFTNENCRPPLPYTAHRILSTR